MTDRSLDIVGVGNAIVDVLVNVDAATLTKYGLEKGVMHLVLDENTVWQLYEDLGPAMESSGGSVANTVAHMADARLACGFVGKTAQDQFGKVFASDLRSISIDHCVMPATDGEGTGRCLVLITPDRERTMCTFLGASVSLDATDVVASMPERFGTVLIEGYLWDAPHGSAVIDAALDWADAADARIAVTLSDPGCVERHLDEIRGFVHRYCDILLANEAEACVLAGESDLEAMLDHVAENVPLAAVTRSEHGSVIVSNSTRFWTPAVPVDSLVDTTGAGDAYAAGFLAAILKGASPTEAGTAGAVLAARVIGHFSARQKPQLSPCPVGSMRTDDDTIEMRAGRECAPSIAIR